MEARRDGWVSWLHRGSGGEQPYGRPRREPGLREGSEGILLIAWEQDKVGPIIQTHTLGR